jgi:hypothetical protein
LDAGKTEGPFRFEVALPKGLTFDAFRLLLHGSQAEASCADEHVTFAVEGNPGQAIEWEIERGRGS